MAVAFDAAGGGVHATATPLTWTHTPVAAPTDILVGVTSYTGSTNTVTGVTYGGVTCALLAYINSGGITSGGIALYYLANPPVGAQSVSVAFTGAADTIGGSVSFTGGGSSGAAVTGTAADQSSVSASVPGTTTGGMICAVACFGSSGTFSGTNSVAVRWSLNVSANTASDNAVGGTVVSTGGGAAQTVGYSNTFADDWGLVAVEVRPGVTGITAGLATGAGAAAGISQAVNAGLATAAGIAGGVTVQAPGFPAGLASPAAVPPGRRSPMAWQRRAAPFTVATTPLAVLPVNAGLATGTGTAAGISQAVNAGLATGTGAAGGISQAVNAGLATGAGAAGGADDSNLAIGVTAGLASGTGVAGGVSMAANAGLASGVGAANAPPVGITAGLATGTGAAFGADDSNLGLGITGLLALATAAAFQPAIGITAGLAVGTGAAGNIAEGGGAVATTIWAQANPTGVTGYSTTAETNTTFGVYFTAAQAGTLQAIWFYSPSGSTDLPAEIALYAYTGQTLLSSNASPSWSGAAGSGWVRATLSTVALSSGTGYVAVYYTGPGTLTNQAYIYTGSSPAAWFPSTSADGNLTAPQATPAYNQAPYNTGSFAFPAQYNGNNLNWLLDVEVSFSVTGITAGLATGAGAAGGADDSNLAIGVTAGLATGTGAAGGISQAVNAGLATGAGAACDNVNSSGFAPGVTPGLAVGTGAAGNTTAGIDAGLASGVGAASAPPVGITAGLATGTGAAGNITAGIDAGLATAAGIAGGVTVQAPGFPAGLAHGSGTAGGVSMAANAGLATGAGTAGNTAQPVNAGLAAGAGTAGGVSMAANAGLASGTGVAGGVSMAANAGLATAAGIAGGVTVQAPGFPAGLASGTGVAGGVSMAANAGLASGTGVSQSPGSGITPGLATGTGTALAPATGLVPGLPTGTGTAGNTAVGSGARPPENLGGNLAYIVNGGTAATLANAYGGTLAVAGYEASLIGWTMQQVALTLAENNDETVNVAITQNGSALSLTGATVNMYLKTAAGTPDGSALVLSSAGGSPAITITNSSGGLCSVAIPKADLTAETNTFYRIDVVFSGLQNTCVYGNITWITL